MNRLQQVLLICILWLAALLRFYRLDAQSFWADEGNSVALALRSLPRIAQNSAQDIHPPLYYWLLHGWVALFGTSEVAVRSLSVLFGLVSVALVAWLAHRWQNGWTGVAAALWLALSPFQIYYAQEARMYALAAMLGIGAVSGYACIVENEGEEHQASLVKGVLLYVLCGALGLYTHYSFAFLLIGLNLAFLLHLSRAAGARRPLLVRWGMAQGVVLILYLPWLPTALARVRAWPTVGMALSLEGVLSLAASWLYLGPAGKVVEPSWLAWLPVGWGLLALLVLPRRSGGPAIVLWLLLPLALTVAGGAFREANLKFLLLSTPALCLLLGYGLAEGLRATCRWRWLWSALFAIGVAVPLLAALPKLYADPRLARDDYRGMARYIAAVARPGDAVLLNAPGQEEVFGLYDRSGLPVYPLPRQRPADAVAVATELAAMAARHRHLYALFWATDESDPQQLVESWLDAHAFKAWDLWQGNVRFVLYAFPDAELPKQVINAAFGEPPIVVLQSIGVQRAGVAAGDVMQVALDWQGVRPVPKRYKVSVQLLDVASQVVAQRDAEVGSDARPMSEWTEGETVTDLHGLFIPHGTPPGTYRLFIVLYDAETGARLPVGHGDALAAGAVLVTRPGAPVPPAALRMMRLHRLEFADIALLGYDLYRRGFAHAPETPIHPGDLLHLTLYWQAQVQPSETWRVRLELADGRGYVAVAVDVPPVSEAYPTTVWQAGEIVRGEHDIPLPPDMAPGRYRLRMALTAGEPMPTAVLGEVQVVR